MRRFRNLVCLPSARRMLAIEAALCLLLASIALRLLPFRVLEWFFAHLPRQPEIAGAARTQVREEVRWAVKFATVRLQIRATCFARAIAAQGMLRRRGIGTTLYYGAATQPGHGLTAHVWLMDGDSGVVGHLRAKGYHVLACYPKTVALENLVL
jgi:hypothetical protein